MKKHIGHIVTIEPPSRVAMVLVCEKCGNRMGGSGKNTGHRLASRIKKASKRRFEKGDIRIVVTSCMNACPDDRIAVCIAPTDGGKSRYYEVPAEDLDSSADALVGEAEGMRLSN